MPLQPYLKRIIEGGETLSRPDSAELLQTILRGEATELEIAALLGSLATRGPAPTEIAGFVDTMRFAATPIPLTETERSTLTDTCGTGADSMAGGGSGSQQDRVFRFVGGVQTCGHLA